MEVKTEEHRTAVEASDSPVTVPAEHHTAEKRKGRSEEHEEAAAEERREEEKEIGSKRRRRRRTKCQLALEKESGIGNGFSFSFDARSVEPIETTPKFGPLADLVDLGLGPTTDEVEEKSVAEEDTGGGATKDNGEGTDGI